MRIISALRYDILFQFRHGFYYAYIFITIFYLLALLNLQTGIREIATTILLFTDIAVLGFFFIGAIVLFEKGQNILESLFVTPLRIHEYFLAKIVSLSLISLLSAVLIILIAHGFVTNFFIFMIGLIFSTIFFTLFGFIFAAKAKNVNDYFVKVLGISLFMLLPVIGYLDIYQTPLFYLFPTQATIMLLEIAFKDISTLKIIYAFGCLTIWAVIAAIFAYRSFYKHIILKVGTGT